MTDRDRPLTPPRRSRPSAGPGPSHPTGRAAALMLAVTVAIVVLALVAASGGR
jgi:hypothetical protein